MKKDLELIQGLVGAVTPEQMRHIEGAVIESMGIFIPVTGACDYATTPEHTHPSYSFVLTFDNHSTLIMNGGERRRIQSRRICCFSPDIPHQEEKSEHYSRYIAIMIATKRFEQELREYGLAPRTFNAETFPLPDSLVQTAREFIFEYGNDQPGKKSMLEAIGTKLIHQLIRSIFEIGSPIVSATARVPIQRAQEFIHQNLGQKLTTSSIASAAGLSAAHFSREFKKETGLTPMEYLRHARLNRARSLLIEGNQNLTEIALDCGFNTSSYFSTCFQQRFRLSPSAFRNIFATAES